MEVNYKFKIIMALVVLGVCWYLIYTIYNHSKDLTCNQCVVKFTQTEAYGMKLKAPKEFNVSMMELYEGYLNEQCKVAWDNVNGYIIN